MEFLKDFYIFRILGCPGLLWYQWLQNSSSIKGEKYCPQEIVLSIRFLLDSNPHHSLTAGIQFEVSIENNRIQPNHLILTPGLFRGSQLNWAALMKEAFAIYMSVKKLSFYLTDAKILLRSNHKPLEKFLQKNTLNSKVNNWTTIHESQDQPIKPIQQQDSTEDTTTPAAPTEVEGPPSSRLRSKMKQQSTAKEQRQLECNPAQQGQPECNPAQTEVNTVEIAPKRYSLVQWTKTLLWAKRVSKHKAPVAARCTLIVAMAVYKLKCNQDNV